MSIDANNTPHLIRREDYRPLFWTVDTVALEFTLDAEQTLVEAVLRCKKNPLAAPQKFIRLYGEALELLSVEINHQLISPDHISHFNGGIDLALDQTLDSVEIKTRVRIQPAQNHSCSGLYQSGSGLFTQCEAEGFRRITFFPDRPDNMARYKVKLVAEREHYPILLSNGNLVDAGELPEGKHYACWHDPFAKPSYLFALVAARLEALEKRVLTASGREVLLQVWVEPGQLERAQHALDCLIHALRWDEEQFGLELDLDRFMIVAVGDFNMGAMENKGLNIFNARYILASPETATDHDYANIESVVGHEYFHNWSGNRVTCRDWFQLTLKEGLTVFRDQCFSADQQAQAVASAGAAAQHSARAVKRIADVNVLRAAQFPEDNGPMAHPIRPDRYQAIDNFYTATVYEKGAEVIRMLHTLVGAAGFRRGMDLYFARHDGQAVTCEAFVNALNDANEPHPINTFMRWYGQAGTPRLTIKTAYDPQRHIFTLSCQQQAPAHQTADTPLPLPLAIGLIDPSGADLPLHLVGEHAEHPDAGKTTRVLLLEQWQADFHFSHIHQAPVPSVLRGFSAPLILQMTEPDEADLHRLRYDSDPFNRWQAGQSCVSREINRIEQHCRSQNDSTPPPLSSALTAALANTLSDNKLSARFRALTLTPPPETILLESQTEHLHPNTLRQAIIHFKRALATALAPHWQHIIKQPLPTPWRYHPHDAGQRSLHALALQMLCCAGDEEAAQQASALAQQARDLNTRMVALEALMCWPDDSFDAQRNHALTTFRQHYQDEPLVLDKWFALQAAAWRWHERQTPILNTVRELMTDSAFVKTNPNKVYALLATFFRNHAEFHLPDGSGYDFWLEILLDTDQRNPQLAARLARALDNWRRLSPTLQQHIAPRLQHALQNAHSDNVREILQHSLQANAAKN